jgi:hypothetical protein
MEPCAQLWKTLLVVEEVNTIDRYDLLKRQGSTKNLTEVHPWISPSKFRSLTGVHSDRSHGNPKDWWRKRPKVKNITQTCEREQREEKR